MGTEYSWRDTQIHAIWFKVYTYIYETGVHYIFSRCDASEMICMSIKFSWKGEQLMWRIANIAHYREILYDR